MKGNILRIIAVGKLKTGYWREAASHYLNLARKWRPIECVEVKDGDPALAIRERNRQEGEKILHCLAPGESAIALCESGVTMGSEKFAALLGDDVSSKYLTFIIGGPFGLDEAVLARCGRTLSLSPMTWPHELARVLLLEQIYRAGCILRNSPYHHK